jgi:TPR repeat protein
MGAVFTWANVFDRHPCESGPRSSTPAFHPFGREGLAEAQVELGAIYGKGLGVAADRRRSIELYKLAAVQNDAHANFNLGIIYINGDGAERDIEIGVRYMSKAARLGMGEADEILTTASEVTLEYVASIGQVVAVTTRTKIEIYLFYPA